MIKNWFIAHKYLLILIFLFIGQFLLISPIGEFPLNDDWVHAEMVQHWTNTNEFRLNPYTGPTFYTQLIYARGLSELFGFSFTLLRISTLVLTACLVFGLFYFLKYVTKNNHLAFFTALLLWLNPITYQLSFTFMTDIPALAFLFFSLIAFYFGTTKTKPSLFWFGSLSAVLGFFIRQTTILILPAISLATLIQPQLRKFKYWLAILIPGSITTLLYWYLQTNHLLGEGTSYHQIADTRTLIKHVIWGSLYTGLYVGLFSLPLTISVIKKNLRAWYFWGGLAGFSISAWLYFLKNKFFPYAVNTINLFGLGPFTDTLAGTYNTLVPQWVWLLVSACAGIGFGFLVVTIIQILKTKNFLIRPSFFILLFVLIFTGPIIFYTGFDRYYVALFLATAIILTLEYPRTKPHWLGWTGLLLMAIYTVSQTHFYLNWNRVRAELTNLAFSHYHAKADTLDAGYEWTGFYDYWLAAQIPRVYRWPANSPWWIKFLMINITREQIISSTPLPGYQPAEKRLVPGLNPNNQLYLLIKNDEATQK